MSIRALPALGVMVLIVMFVLGAIAHDVVPHSHGDEHGGESAVWVQMHSALRHEDKKMIVDSSPVPLMVFAVVVIVGTARIRSRELREVRNPFRERYLMRGIAPYRAFV